MIVEDLAKKVAGKDVSIVFTEGWDPRVMGAAVRLKKGNVVRPILLGEHEQVNACATENGFDITGIEVIAPSEYPDIDKMAVRMVELRRGRLDMEAARQALTHLFHCRYRSSCTAAGKNRSRSESGILRFPDGKGR